MLSYLFQSPDLSEIRLEYAPTPRNGVLTDLLRELGFSDRQIERVGPDGGPPLVLLRPDFEALSWSLPHRVEEAGASGPTDSSSRGGSAGG